MIITLPFTRKTVDKILDAILWAVRIISLVLIVIPFLDLTNHDAEIFVLSSIGGMVIWGISFCVWFKDDKLPKFKFKDE